MLRFFTVLESKLLKTAAPFISDLICLPSSVRFALSPLIDLS